MTIDKQQKDHTLQVPPRLVVRFGTELSLVARFVLSQI